MLSTLKDGVMVAETMPSTKDGVMIEKMVYRRFTKFVALGISFSTTRFLSSSSESMTLVAVHFHSYFET